VKVRRKRALLLALLLDLVWGDPPNRHHPVAWMGTAIGAARQKAPRKGWLAQLLYGTLLVIGGGLTVFGLGRLLGLVLVRLPGPVGWLAEAVFLKMTFSVRGLARAAEEVDEALEAGDLADARRRLSWHLVSRNTAALTPSQVAAATIESVAENASDGVTSPLFYYALGGLPGALTYRFINTADAMLGYRDSAHEWLGKTSAHVDDVANYAPARISAALFTLAAALLGEDAQGAWRVWRRDAGQTASPNAGHPMSAVAGALGVELEKVGQYRLGAGGRPPAVGDIKRSVRLMRVVAVLMGGLILLNPLLAKDTPAPRRRQYGCENTE
jgi:adenosylcobinamide-phosphate synthase